MINYEFDINLPAGEACHYIITLLDNCMGVPAIEYNSTGNTKMDYYMIEDSISEFDVGEDFDYEGRDLKKKSKGYGKYYGSNSGSKSSSKSKGYKTNSGSKIKSSRYDYGGSTSYKNPKYTNSMKSSYKVSKGNR